MIALAPVNKQVGHVLAWRRCHKNRKFLWRLYPFLRTNLLLSSMSNQLKVINPSVNHQDGGEPALGRNNSWSLGGPATQPGVRDPGFTLARFTSEFRFTLVGEGNKRMRCSCASVRRNQSHAVAVSEIGLPSRSKRGSAVSNRNSPNSYM